MCLAKIRGCYGCTKIDHKLRDFPISKVGNRDAFTQAQPLDQQLSKATRLLSEPHHLVLVSSLSKLDFFYAILSRAGELHRCSYWYASCLSPYYFNVIRCGVNPLFYDLTYCCKLLSTSKESF